MENNRKVELVGAAVSWQKNSDQSDLKFSVHRGDREPAPHSDEQTPL